MGVDALWWTLSVLLIGVGLAGTVLPALPGTGLMLAGMVLGAWIDQWTRVGAWALGAITVMAVLSWVIDYAAGVMGARKVGASRQAVLGAAIGTVAGIFAGLVGVLFLPLVGAAVGEYLAQQRGSKDERRALKVGVATWLGVMAGMVAKLALAFMMLGVFVVALFT